jgi:hypothetical protein
VDHEEPRENGPVAVFRSGATLAVETGPRGETIVLRSAAGTVDLTIRMTDEGPVLSLSGVRFEISAADAVQVRCREFTVEARDRVALRSGGDVAVESGAEVRLRSAGATWVDGDYVNLNCLDRTGYHDQQPEGEAPAPGPKAE